MKEISLNIRHHLMLALGTKQFMWDYIDEMYEKNKLEYYKAYIKGDFPNDVAKTRYSAESEEHIIKVMAINSWCEFENNKDFSLIYDLIKKGYKSAWNFFKKSKDNPPVLIDIHLKKYLCKGNFEKSFDTYSESDYYNELFVLLFLCYDNNIDFGLKESRSMLQEYLVTFQENVFARQLREEIFSTRDNYKKDVESLYLDMGFPEKYFKTNRNLNIILDRMLLSGEKKLFKSLYGKEFTPNNSPFNTDEYFSFRSKIFHTSYSKYVGIFSQMVKMSGLNEESFSDVILSKEDMDLILSHFVFSKKGNSATDDEKECIIVACMFIYGITYLYKTLKKLYLEDSKQKSFEELQSIISEYEKKKSVIDTKIHEYDNLIEENTNKIALLESQNTDLVTKNKRLTLELKAQEDNTKELIALRNFMYNLEHEEYADTQTSLDDKIDYINSKKIAIFGGHPNWHSKLKEVFNDIIVVAPERVNIDFSFVDNMDCAFIHSSYCNHSMYDKLMSRLRTNSCKIGYTKGTNIDISINEIYNCLIK